MQQISRDSFATRTSDGSSELKTTAAITPECGFVRSSRSQLSFQKALAAAGGFQSTGIPVSFGKSFRRHTLCHPSREAWLVGETRG